MQAFVQHTRIAEPMEMGNSASHSREGESVVFREYGSIAVHLQFIVNHCGVHQATPATGTLELTPSSKSGSDGLL